MEEIFKLLKTLSKEYLQVIILELMKDQKISYEDITKAYVEYLIQQRLDALADIVAEQKPADVEEVNFFDDFRKTDSEVEPESIDTQVEII